MFPWQQRDKSISKRQPCCPPLVPSSIQIARSVNLHPEQHLGLHLKIKLTVLLDWDEPDIWGKFTIRKILKPSQCPLLDVDELPLLPPFPPLLQLLQADSVGVRGPQRAQRSCRGCCQLSRSSSYQVSWAQWPLSPRHGWRVLDQPLWLLCHGAGASA